MKIAIIGAGGVGGYFGGKLAKAGFDVTFVARGEHLKSIQQNGLIVKSVNGDFKIENAKATDSIKNLRNIDFVIIAVKAWDVKNVAKELSEIINPKTVILPLQNGVMATDELKEFINSENIIAGLCRIISKIEAPGIINHFGVDPIIIFGELDNSISDRVKNIKNIFDKSEINSKIAKDIIAELWKKLIPICTSALLALTKTTYGELCEIKETRQIMIDLIKENYNLSQKMGIKIEDEFVEKSIAFIDTFPYNSTSSLSRDVLEGKPSEIDYQNGTIVKLGEKYGVETPVNKFIYNCILPMEIKAKNNKL